MAPRKTDPDTDPAPGFAERPQAPFEAVPLEGSFSDWLKDVTEEAVERPAPPNASKIVEEKIVKPGKRKAPIEADAVARAIVALVGQHAPGAFVHDNDAMIALAR